MPGGCHNLFHIDRGAAGGCRIGCQYLINAVVHFVFLYHGWLCLCRRSDDRALCRCTEPEWITKDGPAIIPLGLGVIIILYNSVYGRWSRLSGLIDQRHDSHRGCRNLLLLGAGYPIGRFCRFPLGWHPDRGYGYPPDALFDAGRFRYILRCLLSVLRNNGKPCIMDGISDLFIVTRNYAMDIVASPLFCLYLNML